MKNLKTSESITNLRIPKKTEKEGIINYSFDLSSSFDFIKGGFYTDKPLKNSPTFRAHFI